MEMSSIIAINFSSIILILAGLVGLLLSILLNNSLALLASIAYLAAGIIMLLVELNAKKQPEYMR
jgi:hypothetical protein